MRRLTAAMLLGLVASVHGGHAQESTSSGQHIVVKIDGGSVTFKRPVWGRFAPLRFGTVLQDGDTVNLPSNASVTVVCNGFTTAAVVTGPAIQPVPCTTSAPDKPLWWDDVPTFPSAKIDLPPGGLLPTGVIAPQLTMATTYEDKPELRWPRVTGAYQYLVEITGENFKWSGMTNTNSVTPEVSLPAREADNPYEIAVIAYSTGTSATTSASTASPPKTQMLLAKKFAVISRMTDTTLADTAAEIDKLGLAAPVTSFLKAKLFALFGDFDQAITSLQALRGSLSEPARGRILGDVYVAKGSMSEAEKALSEAATLFEKDGDLVGLAAADEAVAKVQLPTPAKRADAAARLRAALSIYQALGDTPDAVRVQGLLASLQGS